MDDPPTAPGQRALRRARFSQPGQVYLLTSVTLGRVPLFADWQVAASVCANLGERRLWRDSQALCWCLMPDHLHAVVSLGASEPLPALLQRIKAVTSRVAKSAGAAAVVGSRVWMPGYHDRAMRRDDDLLAMARYVVMNPVRAGLVPKVGDYPFWDAVWV